MHKHRFTTKVLAGAAIALALTGAAQAQNNRSFVATTGNDANNCSASAYCRTFGAALAVTNAGGEIVVVNSGGYGPATISKSVVITAIGIDASITAVSGNAFTINTSGNVTLTGLNINGGGTGTNGISVQQVGFLRLYKMQIQNFAQNGVIFDTGGNLAIYDSKLTDCVNDGLMVNNRSAQAYVHNTVFDNNQNAGVESVGGGVVIADSSAHYNGIGFYANDGTVALYNDRSSLNATGLGAITGGVLYFADCLVSDNTTAYNITTGGTITGSNPGTTLLTVGQGTSGALSSAIVLQ
jgi:Right handed beta helix region